MPLYSVISQYNRSNYKGEKRICIISEFHSLSCWSCRITIKLHFGISIFQEVTNNDKKNLETLNTNHLFFVSIPAVPNNCDEVVIMWQKTRNVDEKLWKTVPMKWVTTGAIFVNFLLHLSHFVCVVFKAKVSF